MIKGNRISLGEQAELTVLKHYSPKVRSNDWMEFIEKVKGKRKKKSLINTKILFLKFRFYKFFAHTYILIKWVERVIRNKVKGNK
jgi:hypothetical protein